MNLEQATKAAAELAAQYPGSVVSVVERNGEFFAFSRRNRRTANDYKRRGMPVYEYVCGKLMRC